MPSGRRRLISLTPWGVRRVARLPACGLECETMNPWFPRLAMLWVAATMLKMLVALVRRRDFEYGRWDGGAFLTGKVLRSKSLVLMFSATAVFASAVLASVLDWLPTAADRPIVYSAMVVCVVLSYVLARKPETASETLWP